MNNQNEGTAYPTNTATTETPTLFSDVNDVVDTEQYEKSLRNARNWLYVIGGLQIIMGFIEYGTITEQQIAIAAFCIDAFIGALFLALALWSRKKPVVAFTTALVCYIVVVTGLAVLDPSNLFRGMLIKIFAVIALVKANKAARQYEAIKASFGEEV